MTSIMVKAREAYTDLVPLIADLRDDGLSLKSVAARLNTMGHRTQRGSLWSRSTLYALMKREGISTKAPAWWIGKSLMRKRRYAANAARNRRMATWVIGRRAAGATLRQIATELTEQGQRTPRECRWNGANLTNLMVRSGILHTHEGRRAIFQQRRNITT